MESDHEKNLQELRSKIKSYPDFPKKGILFWDIFSAIHNGPTCSLLQNLLVHEIRTKFPQAEAIIGLESRGFLFAFSLAAELTLACIPVRKKGKLPGEVVAYHYELEYGTDTLEIQKSSIKPGLKCVIIDDLIATGGSMAAAVNLISQCQGNVLGCLAIIELESLEGRRKIPEGIPVHSLLKYD